MSLLGTERYLNNQNQSLSDCFAFTPEVEGWDPDVFLSTIIRNYATLPALYEDPDWMYSETDMWFKQHGNDFKRLWLAMRQAYNPIENYDRMEDWSNNDQEHNTDGTTRTTSTVTDGEDSRSVATTDSEALARDVSTSGTAIEVTDENGTLHKTGTDATVTDIDTTMCKTGTDTEVVDDEASSTIRAPGAGGTNQSETANYISAYDGGSTQHDRSVTTASKSEDATSMDNKTTTMTHNTTDTGTDDRSETITHNTTDTNAVDKTVNTTTSGTEAEDATTNRTGSVTESGTQDVTVTTTDEVSGTGNKTNSGTRTGHAHGNIGVTTSQQMLRSEIELRVTNAYGIMAKVFADDMCLGIW